MPPLLELKNVTKVFGGGLFDQNTTVAVDNLSMNIHAEPPRITAIAGESGSGKTTLARLLMGLIEPTTGEVRYLGRSVEEMSKEERIEMKREVQPVFQDPFGVYNPFYRVDHVLTTPALNFHLAESKKEALALIVEALETVGLRAEETLGRFPHQLSGGQRQRVMVARALLLKPKVILADEPVSMVDASLRATILESIRKLNQEIGIAVLYITHDLTTAYQISEDIVVMYEGTMAEVGDVRRVIKEPKHPYTQLLVDSIPQADPNRKWGEGTPLKEAEGGVSAGQGCKFAARCPSVMPMCRESAPPLYRVDERRAASCFLYRESGETTADEVMMAGTG
jgi:peptide/nickel transport system ATP-binding protein